MLSNATLHFMAAAEARDGRDWRNWCMRLPGGDPRLCGEFHVCREWTLQYLVASKAMAHRVLVCFSSYLSVCLLVIYVGHPRSRVLQNVFLRDQKKVLGVLGSKICSYLFHLPVRDCWMMRLFCRLPMGIYITHLASCLFSGMDRFWLCALRLGPTTCLEQLICFATSHALIIICFKLFFL